MTQAQIERYEQLRSAKQQLELVLDATNDEKFYGFSAAVEFTIYGMISDKTHRYVTEKWVVREIKDFLTHLLSDVNEQMSEL